MSRATVLPLIIAAIAPGTLRAEELTVESAPPVVIKAVPEPGSIDVDPGLKEIKVTFSKEMTDGNWSWTNPSQKFPKSGKPSYDEKKRTCSLPITLEPGKEYVIGVNGGRYMNFKDANNRPALPYLIVFRTRE